MPRIPLRQACEMTTCDYCGQRLRIPPGVYYRGMRLHKQEAVRLMKIDTDNEIKAPFLSETEQQISNLLSAKSTDT